MTTDDEAHRTLREFCENQPKAPEATPRTPDDVWPLIDAAELHCRLLEQLGDTQGRALYCWWMIPTVRRGGLIIEEAADTGDGRVFVYDDSTNVRTFIAGRREELGAPDPAPN